ncbi:carboxymuconolactone decarboxylase family protein [Nguyenibacter vanlangensis]|uniref:Carboxymuconolactone decarboxylase family protein n=1 Tax=Nguyenibacter vanlangensis TaxID=1216886 RepID=A0ABZ3D4J8_9PROT
MTNAQRELYDTLQKSWIVFADKIGVKATTEDGSLIGPFNFFLLHPEVTAKLSAFQEAEETNTTLPRRVREIVIITVGAVWGATYELYARGHVAREAGLSDKALAVIASGGIPDDLSDDETIAARLARELATSHRVDDDLYQSAEQVFGRTGLFDIVAVMGVYQTVCAGLALFEVPAPA